MSIEKFKTEPKLDKYDIYNRFKDEEPFYTGACLAGLEDDQAWRLRAYLLGHSHEGRRGVAQGLAGIRTEESYQLREDLLEEAPESTARGLAGDDSEQAWKLRDKIKGYFDKPGVIPALAESLANIDTPKAWDLRRELLQKPDSIGGIFEGLVKVDSEEAWKLREQYYKEYPEFVGESMLGLSGPRVDALNEKIKEINPGAALLQYMGSDDEKAWQMREDLIDSNYFFVGTSLAGLQNEKADAIRKQLLQRLEGLDKEDKRYIYIRKGILQGMNSNYIWEAVK